ncbi:unnamed protein product, partial [Allacma fusca]
MALFTPRLLTVCGERLD